MANNVIIRDMATETTAKVVCMGMLFRKVGGAFTGGVYLVARADHGMALVDIGTGRRWGLLTMINQSIREVEIREEMEYLGYADITLSNFRKE